ncbi:MAG: hypothetical protein ACC618_03475 [Patescibacteria group bacterium]
MRLLWIIILLVILGALGLSLFFVPRRLTIKKISCQSQFGPCSSILYEEVRKNEGTNYRKAKENISQYLSGSALVEQFIIQIKFPVELRVDLVETKPRFAVRAIDEGKIYIVSREGFVISEETSTNLPHIIVSDIQMAVREKVSDRYMFALNIVYDLFNAYQVQKGEIVENSLEVELTGSGKKLIFPLEGDREVLLGALSLILSRLNSESQEFRIEGAENIKEVDLRFENPVLR